MFPQQLQQQLMHLQQLLQPPPPPPPGRGMTSPHPQQILNLRRTSQASLLATNPMLQQALLFQQMQGNLRGFNMAAAPVLHQFFPQATRHSLLGPPPVGVSIKPTRLAFPGLPFQRPNRTFRKDFPKVPERKREADAASSSCQTQGTNETGLVLEAPDLKTEPELASFLPSETRAEPFEDGQPATKRLRSHVNDAVPGETMRPTEAVGSDAKSYPEDVDSGQQIVAGDASGEKNLPEELVTSEVVSSAGSLKVTIQHSSGSRAISTTALKPAHWTSEMGAAEPSPESALKFYCSVCRTDFGNQQNFQSHMTGAQHRQRFQDIQHTSTVCSVSVLPATKEQKLLAEKDGGGQQRWCNTCQVHFTGDLIKHRRTQEHKLAKRSLRPFCTVCSRHFKTPRKFVEHVKSLEHKRKAKEGKLGEKEQGGPEDSEELITVDAVGCFEDDEEEEEEGPGEEDDSEGATQDNGESLTMQAGLEEPPSEDNGGNETYCPDTVYGPDFLVPVAGFLCRLCHKFYPSNSAGRLTHCKSLMHFENLQRYKAMKLQAPSVHPEDSWHPPLDDRPTAAKTATVQAAKDSVALRQGGRSPGVEEASAAPTDHPAAFGSHSHVVQDGKETDSQGVSGGGGITPRETPERAARTRGASEWAEPTGGERRVEMKRSVSDDAATEAPGSPAHEKQPGASLDAQRGSSSGRRRSTQQRAR